MYVASHGDSMDFICYIIIYVAVQDNIVGVAINYSVYIIYSACIATVYT